VTILLAMLFSKIFTSELMLIR